MILKLVEGIKPIYRHTVSYNSFERLTIQSRIGEKNYPENYKCIYSSMALRKTISKLSVFIICLYDMKITKGLY